MDTDTLAYIQALLDKINRTERCLYDCLEEGGVGMGWEVEIDNKTGRAVPKMTRHLNDHYNKTEPPAAEDD